MEHLKKTTLAILLSTILIVSVTCVHALCANEVNEAHGPAPSSGDGESEGPEFPSDSPWPNEDGPGVGPAPNSGDGDPDGSGF